jgi:raffinose/stachyose/melibiose transport system substrate-binding protein
MHTKHLPAVIGLALSATLALSACGSSGQQTSGDPDGEIGGTIKVYSVSSSQAAITAMAEAFMAENAGVTIEVTAAATDTFQQTLATQLASGTAPDIFTVNAGSGTATSVTPLGKAGYLYDLSDRSWAAGQPEAYKSVNQYEGKTLALSAVVGAIGAIYNTATMESLGVTAPTTFSEVLQLCKDVADQGKVAFALGIQTPSNGQFIAYALGASLIDPDTNDRMMAGELTFAETGWKADYEKYMEMNEAGCFQKNPTGTASEEAYQSVATGAALASVAVNGALSQIQSYDPDAELSMFPLPATDNPSDLKLAASASGSWGVNAKSSNLATALAFIDYVATHEADYAKIAGTIPMDPDQVPDDLSPALAVIASFVADGKTMSYPSQTWPGPSVQQMQFQVVQNMFAGSMTVDQALEAWQAEFDQVMAQK